MVKVSETEDCYVYVIMHDNKYHHMDIGDISYTSDQSLYKTYVCFNNTSIKYEPRYSIDYGLWAGPIEKASSPNINPILTTEDFLGYFSNEGSGKVVHHMESIYQFDDVIYIPKH